MKLSISTPFKASTSHPQMTPKHGGFSHWFGQAPPAFFTHKREVNPASFCRQALVEALQQDRPHPNELAALRRVLAEPSRAPRASPPEIRHSPPCADSPLAAPERTKPFFIRRSITSNPVQELGVFPNQENFAAIALAYQSSGGIFRAEDLVRLAGLGNGHHPAELISLITSGQILSFQWRKSYWVPIFQFEIGTMLQKNCAHQVILELTDTFDDWEKVVWFVQPNAWLDRATPLALIEEQLPRVLDAARADRVVAAG